MSLCPCPQCRRHIRHTESACPFCAAAVSCRLTAPPRAPRPPGRLSRSALAALGALVGTPLACGDDNGNNDDNGSNGVPVYGVPVGGMSSAGGSGGSAGGANAGAGGSSGGAGGNSAGSGGNSGGSGGVASSTGGLGGGGAGAEPMPMPVYGLPIGPLGDAVENDGDTAGEPGAGNVTELP